MRILIAALVLSGLPLAALASEQARPAAHTCLPRQQIVKYAEKLFGEHLQFSGVDQNGGMVQLFAADSGTWTLAITLPNTGITCFVAGGQGWAVDRTVIGLPH